MDSHAPSAHWIDPERAFLALFADEPRVVWLDSGPFATRGTSIMGVPSRVVSVREPSEALPTLERLLAESSTAPSPLGWMGWLSYETGAAEQGAAHHRADHPAMVLAHLESGLVFDHTERTVRAIGDIDVRDALGDEHVADAFAPAETPAPTAITWRHDESAYLSLIAECQRLIGDGETYQICLCNEAVVDVDADPVAVFRRLRRRSPTHHGALFRIDDLALVSGSPEQFLTLSGGRIVTRPMKGTRPRGIGEADDDLARELHDSEKERAENLMIADLMRNDLARVAEVGSVAVTELFGVEHYATVHQLVSTVEATLAHGRSVVDLLRATLPAGSMTGAPKHSAMGAIARLEAGPRGVFSGAFGRFDAEGGADLAVVIRSILLEPGRATIGVGGGITALSLPEDEYDETMLKAESMLWALGAVSTRSR